MAERTTAFAPSVAALADFAGMRVVADVGGDQGTLLAAILSRHQHLRGMLVELPTVTDRAAAALKQAGDADRCQIVAGSLRWSASRGRLLPAGQRAARPADDRAVTILRERRKTAGADGRVFVVERLISDDPRAAVPVLLGDLNSSWSPAAASAPTTSTALSWPPPGSGAAGSGPSPRRTG